VQGWNPRFYVGWLIARGMPGGHVEHYREAPVSAQSLLTEARCRGRSELLEMMQYQAVETIHGQTGLLFESDICEYVDGVVAIYYTGQLQFLPNPFSKRDISVLYELFPRTLAPFDR
jgi:hypothetical protein